MSTEVWILVATAVLAVVAIGAAVIAVRAARRLAAVPSTPNPEPIEVSREVAPARRPTGEVTIHTPTHLPPELEPRIVEGRLIVPPTQQQVVQTALGRPGVRLSVLAHGLAHALRAESRDRISALMRREYRRRRRERAQAGRRAVRAARPTPPSDQWLGS
ncbi:MAG: hypothetical protein ABWX57_02965 [Aeromicrobium sp.]